MKFCQIIVSSKNEQSLKNFKKVFLKGKNSSFNKITYAKNIQKKTKKKIVTILKSPHVNKTAQEQFEEKLFSTVFITGTYSISTLIIFLKRLRSILFTDTSIQLRFLIKKNFVYNASKSTTNVYKSILNAQEYNKNVNFLSLYKSKTKLNSNFLKTKETIRKELFWIAGLSSSAGRAED